LIEFDINETVILQEKGSIPMPIKRQLSFRETSYQVTFDTHRSLEHHCLFERSAIAATQGAGRESSMDADRILPKALHPTTVLGRDKYQSCGGRVAYQL
jgi:hypothetical protein